MTARHMALASLFVGPAAAMTDLVVSYYLVYPSQGAGSRVSLHVATILAVVVAAAGILMSRRVLARKNETAKVDEFLAVSGVALNIFFLLVIVGFAIPKFILGAHD